MFQRSDLVKMLQNQDREIDPNGPRLPIVDMIKSAYKSPGGPDDALNFFIDRPKSFIMENNGDENQWNMGNCVDDEIFAYMSQDIASPTITPTTRLTFWILYQSTGYSRSVFRTLTAFPKPLFQFLRLILDNFYTFSSKSPEDSHSPTLILEILHRCVSPRKSQFFQELFDAHLFTDLPFKDWGCSFCGDILILYGHADGFKLKVDKGMIKLVNNWIEAVKEHQPTICNSETDLMRWLQYACRNTAIWDVLPKKTRHKIKFLIKKQFRVGCAKWLNLHIIKNKHDEIRKDHIENHLHIKCSNPKCSKEEYAESELRKCTRCWFARYCSRSCQEAHYGDHRKFCKKIACCLG